MIRALAFIALRLLELCCAVLCPLMPSLAIGVAYGCELGMDRLRLPPAPGPDPSTARLISAIHHLLDGNSLWAPTIYGPNLTEHALAYFKQRYISGEIPLERYERMVATLIKADLTERES
jgi:hypothetical protein